MRSKKVGREENALSFYFTRIIGFRSIAFFIRFIYFRHYTSKFLLAKEKKYEKYYYMNGNIIT